MKCIRCGHDSKYSERPGRRCPQCNGAFAFEPKAGDKYTDKRFETAIRRVSADGRVAFLAEHVRYDLARDHTDGMLVAMGIAAVGTVGGILATIVTSGACVLAPIAAGFVLVVLALVRQTSPPRRVPEHAAFAAAWSRYVEVHGAPPKLVPDALPAVTPPIALRDELTLYGFDRAVICDRPETVRLLLANDVHFENNCAVLTADGYPPAVFDTVRRMLRNNPRLEVFVLHDATVEGCTLAHRLRADPAWFAEYGTVYDVAFRPAQADRWPKLLEPGLDTVPPDPALTEAERRWLELHRLSIACLPPEQLVKRLFRAMHDLPARKSEGGDLVWVGDATTSDGGGDSFG